MTETKTYCDHCGKELNNMKDYCDTEIMLLNYVNTDLCVKCINELQGLIEHFVKEREKQ